MLAHGFQTFFCPIAGFDSFFLPLPLVCMANTYASASFCASELPHVPGSIYLSPTFVPPLPKWTSSCFSLATSPVIQFFPTHGLPLRQSPAHRNLIDYSIALPPTCIPCFVQSLLFLFLSFLFCKRIPFVNPFPFTDPLFLTLKCC